jgi:hypothetical protein
VAHIFASLMFGLVAFAAAGLIAAMLFQARTAIAMALGFAAPEQVRRYRAPVRVTVRRTPAWPVLRPVAARRAA